MEEMIAFIRARLGEEEARAGSLLEDARWAIEALKDPRFLGREIPGWHSWPDVEAMCSRALREVEAKRAILRAHCPQTPKCRSDVPRCATCLTGRDGWAEDRQADPWPCLTARLLAAAWSDHPDYRQEWAP